MITLETLVSAESRGRLFWSLQCTAWLSVSILLLTFTLLSRIGWHDALWLVGIRTVFGFTVTTAILRPVYQVMRRKSVPLWLMVLLVALLCGLTSLVDVALTRLLGSAVGVDMQSHTLKSFLQVSLLMRYAVYGIWSVFYFSISYWLDTQRIRQELAQAEIAAQISELKALRAQVNPHFLFNALGSILAEAEQPQTVRELTLALSGYLRFSLQGSHELKPLSAELDALNDYLTVEQARFGDNFCFFIDVDGVAGKTRVPGALVQPLLENAVKYGQRSHIRPLRLKIDARVEQDWLQVIVCNSGEWVQPESNPSTKTGLANLRRRLQLLYKGQAMVEIRHGDGEVEASIRLPLTAPFMPARGVAG